MLDNVILPIYIRNKVLQIQMLIQQQKGCYKPIKYTALFLMWYLIIFIQSYINSSIQKYNHPSFFQYNVREVSFIQNFNIADKIIEINLVLQMFN
ncbi:hypothetical protein pb186bvf_007889 [Paramecium bursaria]